MKAESPGDIHYGSFLLKKAWRIIPSWFVVTCVFYFACAWFMIPEDRLAICNTASRSAFFAADFYIDSRYDYFNQTAHQNLFLHYWYLSITCQMYIILPLLVMGLLRWFGKKTVVAVLAVIGLLSLALYVLTTNMQVPEGIRSALLAGTGMKTTYYHLLPRLWEILAGGAILLLPAWAEKRRLRMALETLSVAGLIFSFYWYATGSPKVYLAVLCAILFIRYGGEGPVSRLLAWRPFQWVGTISFSLYLWHWPIMAAWKYVSMGQIAWWDELCMVLLSFLLAYIAWRLVERLKMPKPTSRLLTIGVCVAPLLLMLFFAVGLRPYYKSIRASVSDGLVGKGLMSEMKAEIAAVPADDKLLVNFPSAQYSVRPSYIGTDEGVAPSFLLIGDSHAIHSFHGMHRYCSGKGLRGITLNNSIIPFWWCYWCYEDNTAYWNEARADALLEYIRQQPDVQYVFITLRWQTRLFGTPAESGGETMDWREMKSLSQEGQDAIRAAGLRETCRRITETGKRVVLLAAVPDFPSDRSPYSVARRTELLTGKKAPECLVPVEQHRAASRYSDMFRQLVNEGHAWAVIDCAEALRQGDVYRTLNDAGDFLYSDTTHLTYAGSLLVGRYVMQEWERLRREDPPRED